MRVNVYAEEMTEQIEVISKQIDGHNFTGLRLYLHMPVTVPHRIYNEIPDPTKENTQGLNDTVFDLQHAQIKGPFIHRPGDDDSSAVTFWGKRDLRIVLKKMLEELDKHYSAYDTKQRRLPNDPNVTRACEEEIASRNKT